MKNFSLLLVAVCLVVEMTGVADAAQFLAQVDGENLDQGDEFTLTVVTFNGQTIYDSVQMEVENSLCFEQTLSQIRGQPIGRSLQHLQPGSHNQLSWMGTTSSMLVRTMFWTL